jgi:hypothetical protein
VPYKSDKQRKFMHANHPKVAKKWDDEVVDRAKKYRGNPKTMEFVKGRDDDKPKTMPYNRAKEHRSKEDTQMARNKDASFMDYMQGRRQGFNPYAAGQKRYGASARSAPNVGPTGSPEGYDMRERKNNARRNAMLRKMKAKQSGRHMSSDALRKKNYGV